MKETVAHLIEVSVQEAAGEVGGSFHQLEKAHKVVAVDCSECLHGQLYLRGIPHLVAELLNITVWTRAGSYFLQ